MRLVLGHNYYSSATPSGENQVFEAERQLLLKKGHEVEILTRDSDEIRSKGGLGKIQGALAVPWNPWMAASAREMVERFKPDVIHVHNTFPLLSPSIFRAVRKKAARVLTLHNYRLFCPVAIPMRDGKICTECLDKRSSMPSLIHGCYRSSRVATLPLAVSVGLHRLLGTWKNEVDAFITFSEFQRDLMVEAGLPPDKVYIKPNFYPGEPKVKPWDERKPYVVFAGRLTAEKGVVNLMRAWREWGSGAPNLYFLGDGELRPDLEKMANDLPVRFLGQLGSKEAQSYVADAHLLILPSECFEGFPMVIREAFAFGTPAAVSNIGPLPSIVQHNQSGIVFEPSSPESLLSEVRRAWETPGFLRQLGGGARREFEKKYTEDTNHTTLMDIYQKAIEVSRNG